MKTKNNVRNQVVFTLADLILMHELCIEARARHESAQSKTRDAGFRNDRIGGLMVGLKTLLDTGDYQ